jgi:hypothetical protein
MKRLIKAPADDRTSQEKWDAIRAEMNKQIGRAEGWAQAKKTYKAEFDKYDRWFKKIANKVGVKLERFDIKI